MIFDLDNDYKNGIYLGQVVCPPEYPQKAPNISLITENGRYKTYEGICLSITDYH